MAGLADAVKNRLGLSLEVFAEHLRDDEAFGVLMEKVGNNDRGEVEPVVIEVRPCSDRDYRFVGMNSKIKFPNPEVGKVRKYL